MTLSKIVGEVKVPTSRGIWCKEKGTPLKFIHKTQIKALERKDVSSTDATKSGPVQTALWGWGGRAELQAMWETVLLFAVLLEQRFALGLPQHRACQAASLPPSLSKLPDLASFSCSRDGPAEKVQVF